jgi:DNA-binding CsgD family transcriptional regulator
MNPPLLDRNAAELTGALRVITNPKIGDDRWAIACANVLRLLLAADRVAAFVHRRHGTVADGPAAPLARDFPFVIGPDGLPSPGIRSAMLEEDAATAADVVSRALALTVRPSEAFAISIVMVYDRATSVEENQHARTLLEIVEPVLASAAAMRIPFDRAANGASAANEVSARGRISSPLPAEQIATLRARYRLTRRELDVTRLLVRGKSNAEIADRLSISVHTARHHTERVLGKIGVRSRAAIASVLSSLGF